MADKLIVRASVDAKTKREASAVLASMGLTASDAVRLMFARVAADKTFPFEALTPNSETVDAMKAARRGDTTKVGSIESLLADLHAGD
ncbi:type II toxin-antitoxin system RelB/DinJ family antitoxin [Methylobacterium marchantiae]|uniref:Type II toxin-antitoxin system RelB/DinJ family antitoxin n=1 Tax=Methylobacterium marchantiae TaxID=600331 RepID=A0ABW3X1Z2_9HYPH|nr:hypothetical protein AIGOOFII_3905 [Methylobacterium marchantiae]